MIKNTTGDLSARIEQSIEEARKAGKTLPNSQIAWMRDWPRLVAEGDPHPWYGPCDGFGPGGHCSECTGEVELDAAEIFDRALSELTVLRDELLRLQRARAASVEPISLAAWRARWGREANAIRSTELLDLALAEFDLIYPNPKSAAAGGVPPEPPQ